MSTAQASSFVWARQELAPLKDFLQIKSIPGTSWPTLEFVNQADLPKPFNHLLTQPLMTKALSQYYHCTPKIRAPLYAVHDPIDNTYSRAIVMIIDNNKLRDNAIKADELKQSTLIELGLITMNFNALPQVVIEQVTKTQIPFGTLLSKHQINSHHADLHFFKITCTSPLAQVLNCHLGDLLYGRTHTLIRNDNLQWLAHTVEIFPKKYGTEGAYSFD